MPKSVPTASAHLEKPSPAPGPAAIHLLYLDGLRGLSALYIVLYHGAMAALPAPDWVAPAGLLHRLKQMLESSGPTGVAVFIVLSGYLLALPTLRTGRVRNGFVDYIKRRAIRILPPYYAALAGTLLFIWLIPRFGTTHDVWWDHALPALEWPTIITHLLLIHDVAGRWASAINGPMWSVAVEWQIYFAFPLILLPVARRIGIIRMTVAAVLFTTALCVLCHVFWPHPWFVGLFAMGASAAAIAAGIDPSLRRLRDDLNWRAIAWAAFAASLVVLWLVPFSRIGPWADLLVGTAAASLMIDCTRQLTSPRPAGPTLALRLLSARPLILLGAFSYSLYLTHAPIVAVADSIARSQNLSPPARAMFILFPGTIAALLVAYLFYLVFERPCVKILARKRVVLIKTPTAPNLDPVPRPRPTNPE